MEEKKSDAVSDNVERSLDCRGVFRKEENEGFYKAEKLDKDKPSCGVELWNNDYYVGFQDNLKNTAVYIGCDGGGFEVYEDYIIPVSSDYVRQWAEKTFKMINSGNIDNDPGYYNIENLKELGAAFNCDRYALRHGKGKRQWLENGDVKFAEREFYIPRHDLHVYFQVKEDKDGKTKTSVQYSGPDFWEHEESGECVLPYKEAMKRIEGGMRELSGKKICFEDVIDKIQDKLEWRYEPLNCFKHDVIRTKSVENLFERVGTFRDLGDLFVKDGNKNLLFAEKYKYENLTGKGVYVMELTFSDILNGYKKELFQFDRNFSSGEVNLFLKQFRRHEKLKENCFEENRCGRKIKMGK